MWRDCLLVREGGGGHVRIIRPGHPRRNMCWRLSLGTVLLQGGSSARHLLGGRAADHGGGDSAATVLLLGLHPPVLEPDLDLALGEAEG